jgi:hypothetical protein
MKERAIHNGEGQDDRVERFCSYLHARGHQESTTRAYLVLIRK